MKECHNEESGFSIVFQIYDIIIECSDEIRSQIVKLII
jgi:hypothetical protein